MKSPFEFREKQGFTGASTSVNVIRLPIIYKRIPMTADYTLDYGCGKYPDHVKNVLTQTHYLPFDPFNQPHDINLRTWDIVQHAIRSGKKVDVVCSNVLNIIDNDKLICEITDLIKEIIALSKSMAYIKVHEGDKTGIGKQTGADSYQRNELTEAYLKYFPGAVLKYDIIRIKGED